MAFYDMYPMGSGGMNVGGISVGGMYGGAPLTEAQKAGRKLTRAETERLAGEIYLANPALGIRGALAQASAQRVAPARESKRKTPQQLLEGKARAKLIREQKKAGQYEYVPKVYKSGKMIGQVNMFDSVSRRVRPQHMSSITNQPFSQADIMELDMWLREKGYGMEDLEGSGFFSDIYSGLKDVGRTALHVAPHLLPYML